MSSARFLVGQARNLLSVLGLSVTRRRPVDTRRWGEAPEVALRMAVRFSRPLLVDVPIVRFRSMGMTVGDGHPFVDTLKSGEVLAFEGSPLEAYYAAFRPQSACDVLGVHEVDAPGLAGLPPTAFVAPWQDGDPSVLPAIRDECARSESAAHGFDLGIADGWSAYGPVSPLKGRLEVQRLHSLRQSIRTNGYVRSDDGDGDLEGWMLTTARGEWCLQITRGQHRLAVASVLGFESLPVRLYFAPVKREEHMYWPQVAQGRIRPEAAIAVFDRVMAGHAGWGPSPSGGHLMWPREQPAS